MQRPRIRLWDPNIIVVTTFTIASEYGEESFEPVGD